MKTVCLCCLGYRVNWSLYALFAEPATCQLRSTLVVGKPISLLFAYVMGKETNDAFQYWSDMTLTDACYVWNVVFTCYQQTLCSWFSVDHSCTIGGTNWEARMLKFSLCRADLLQVHHSSGGFSKTRPPFPTCSLILCRYIGNCGMWFNAFTFWPLYLFLFSSPNDYLPSPHMLIKVAGPLVVAVSQLNSISYCKVILDTIQSLSWRSHMLFNYVIVKVFFTPPWPPWNVN